MSPKGQGGPEGGARELDESISRLLDEVRTGMGEGTGICDDSS